MSSYYHIVVTFFVGEAAEERLPLYFFFRWMLFGLGGGS